MLLWYILAAVRIVHPCKLNIPLVLAYYSLTFCYPIQNCSIMKAISNSRHTKRLKSFCDTGLWLALQIRHVFLIMTTHLTLIQSDNGIDGQFLESVLFRYFACHLLTSHFKESFFLWQLIPFFLLPFEARLNLCIILCFIRWDNVS